MLTRTNHPAQAINLPQPRVLIHIRTAMPGASDLKLIDDLQKMHTRMVGWMPTAQLEAHIASGSTLIAEDGSRFARMPEPQADNRKRE